MKHIIRKAFWSSDKEEKWLNELAAKGLAMTDYSWCRYVFEETDRGEYCYRIDLLEHPVIHPESRDYIRFAEEMGAEFVASYMKWVYFRKKTIEGEFELYTDLDSKIRNARRVITLWNTFAVIEFAAGGINILFGILRLTLEGQWSINLFIGLPLVVLGFTFLVISYPVRKRLRSFRKEKNIRE